MKIICNNSLSLNIIAIVKISIEKPYPPTIPGHLRPQKFIAFIILFLSLHFSLKAQDDVLQYKITISQENVPMDKIFRELESRYTLYFSYTDKTIPENLLVTIHASNMPLHLVLEEIFKNTSIVYRVTDKYVILIHNLRMEEIPPNRKNFFIKRVDKNSIGFTKGFNISVGLDVTIGSSFRRLASSSSEGKSIMSWRRNEKAKLGFSAELTASHYFPSGIVAGLGVGILNVGEKGEFNMSESEEECRDGYDRDGNRYDRYDRYDDNDQSQTTTWSHNLVYTNSYTFLTVPVFAGYRFKSNRLTVAVQAGILPSFLISKSKIMEYYNYYDYLVYSNRSSSYPNEALYPQKINYKGFVMNYSFQAVLFYTRSRITYSLGPSYKLLSSIYRDSAPLKQKPFLLGLSAGIRYKFK